MYNWIFHIINDRIRLFETLATESKTKIESEKFKGRIDELKDLKRNILDLINEGDLTN